MPPQGLRPHTHEERQQVALQLLEGWRRTFAGRLVAVASTASFARGSDRLYSDLELVVFLRDLPGPDDDQYLQRVVGGLLIEAEYVTEASYLERYEVLPHDWYFSGSAPLHPLYNAPVIDCVRAARDAIVYPEEAYLLRAAERFLDVQESFGKVLSAVSVRDRSAVPLLVADAVTQALITLSFLNRRPFTTLATFVPEGRAFTEKPSGFDDLLDIVEEGCFDELDQIGEVIQRVFVGFEEMFDTRGHVLYDKSLDPALPNRSYTSGFSQGR